MLCSSVRVYIGDQYPAETIIKQYNLSHAAHTITHISVILTSSAPAVNTDNISSNGWAYYREGNAAETEIVQKMPSGSSERRRIIPFYSRKGREDEFRPGKRQDRALGGRELLAT
jgi:hypothetical protein